MELVTQISLTLVGKEGMSGVVELKGITWSAQTYH